MESKITNPWFRGFDVIVGLVLIISSVVVFFGAQSSPLSTIANLLILSVLLLGISKLGSGIVAKDVATGYRWTNLFSGTACILLALYAYLFPPVSLSTTITILMVGLLLYGIDSFIVGFVKSLTSNIRAMLITAGLISVIASLLGFFDSTLATIAAVSFISLALLADGIEELTAGITGHTAY